ncbi:MAG TPA: glycine dehydrogenase, partial [Gemmataceae bacterium]|nr:glycine dehydrogenase [Gemmataceae bacterium]
MSYLLNTPDDQKAMLARVRVNTVADLFAPVPAELRLNRPLDIPPALCELELIRHIEQLAARNRSASGAVCFLGGGAYDHFIPSVVDAVAGRGEFYTAYTPYQAEASQGTLQAVFEYQTLMCQLTGMDVANASLYEGGSAVAEAVLMALGVTGRHGEVLVAESVHPEYRQTFETYVANLNCRVK